MHNIWLVSAVYGYSTVYSSATTYQYRTLLALTGDCHSSYGTWIYFSAHIHEV